MIKKTLLIILFTTNVHALDLFKADYTVFKDGKKIGVSSIELTKNAPYYTITDKTNGTHGMASFLGFKRSEATLFTENKGIYAPDSYEMNQKVAFNKRHSDYQIDKENHKAYGNDKGDQWETVTEQHFLTPNLVSLKLFNDICIGKTTDLNYDVLKKGKIQQYQFSIASKNNNIIEVEKIHSKPSRVTKLWLDTKQKCLPIRTYHIEEDEEPLETKLISIITQSS